MRNVCCTDVIRDLRKTPKIAKLIDVGWLVLTDFSKMH